MGEVKLNFHALLTSTLEGGEWSPAPAAVFLETSPWCPLKRTAGGDHRDSLDAMKRNDLAAAKN
jgi:hypothetical protein